MAISEAAQVKLGDTWVSADKLNVAISTALVQHNADELVRIVKPFLDAFFEGETISRLSAENIALGMIAVSGREALLMDGGGWAMDLIANRLYNSYGPKATRKKEALSDQEVATSVLAEHAIGLHDGKYVGHCNSCISELKAAILPEERIY